MLSCSECISRVGGFLTYSDMLGTYELCW